jgi:hypothetical protein
MKTLPRARAALGALVVVLAAGGCRSREQPPATPPPPPAVTTTTTTTTTLPAPPPVWRSAKWGMTAAEVLATFPGEAQRPDAPASFGLSRPGTAELVIPAYETDGARFHVLFGFSKGALDRIQLAAPKADYTTCDDVEKRLMEEHQEPSSHQDTVTSMRTKERVWTLPAETITLVCADKPSLGFRTVTLDYAVAVASPSSPQ